MVDSGPLTAYGALMVVLRPVHSMFVVTGDEAQQTDATN